MVVLLIFLWGVRRGSECCCVGIQMLGLGSLLRVLFISYLGLRSSKL